MSYIKEIAALLTLLKYKGNLFVENNSQIFKQVIALSEPSLLITQLL